MRPLATFSLVFIKSSCCRIFQLWYNTIHILYPTQLQSGILNCWYPISGNMRPKAIKNHIFSDNPKQLGRLEAHQSLKIWKLVYVHSIPIAINKGFIDPVNKLGVIQIIRFFERFHRYKLKEGFTKDTALTLRILKELQTGDFVTHIDHGIGRFSGFEKSTSTVERKKLSDWSIRIMISCMSASIHCIRSVNTLVKRVPNRCLIKIGSDTWANLKRKAKRQKI